MIIIAKKFILQFWKKTETLSGKCAWRKWFGFVLLNRFEEFKKTWYPLLVLLLWCLHFCFL